MLLSNLKLLAQVDNSHPYTGWCQKTDTANIAIPIYNLRQANIKMLERLYLLEVNKQQDSIIRLKDYYINEQNKIISDFQDKVYNVNQVNVKLNENIEKYKRRNKIIGYSASAGIIALLIGLITK